MEHSECGDRVQKAVTFEDELFAAKSSSPSFFTGTLVISGANVDDAGQYRCEAENRLGKLQQSLRVLISG